MFTLIQPIAAVFFAVFAAYCSKQFELLHFGEMRDGSSLPLWSAGVAAVVGWLFVGRRIGRAIWHSVYQGVQGVVLAAIAISAVMAVGEVFYRGYHRRYDEPMEALTGYFSIVIDWLREMLVQDFLVLTLGGGVVIGLVLHVLWLLMERRRNDRG
ncbi:MAG: TrgA family protein [Rhodobacter sp.]|nr:TrgA family protein [Paracoccaceae bacterium]MCC0078773.1 TrgA family protein [Rhodobacter sp.]